MGIPYLVGKISRSFFFFRVHWLREHLCDGNYAKEDVGIHLLYIWDHRQTKRCHGNLVKKLDFFQGAFFSTMPSHNIAGLTKGLLIPSRSLTYPLKIRLPKRKLVFQPPFFRGYVKLRGSNHGLITSRALFLGGGIGGTLRFP